MSRVLVLRALGMGDLLVSVPALRGLRAAFPAAGITLAAPEGLRELAELTGAVDELLPTSGLGELRWRHEPPAVAVNLHGSGPQSVADLMATRPARLLTHAHSDYPAIDGPRWGTGVHEARRWCDLLEHYGIPADPADLTLPRPHVPSPAPGAVVIHPGAAYGARRWPVDRYARVAKTLAARGHRIVVTGDAGERELAGAVGGEVLAGRTTLSELAALIADATLVVCGDTGVGHLATAYGTPSVLVFGPVPPWQWGPPPGTEKRHVVVWSGREGPAFTDEPDAGLLRIGENRVLEEAEVLIGRPQGTVRRG